MILSQCGLKMRPNGFFISFEIALHVLTGLFNAGVVFLLFL